MDKEERIELMEAFEHSATRAELDLDLSTKNVEYVDKLTKICYYFYIEGIALDKNVLTMESIDG